MGKQKTARVDQIPLRDDDSVRSVELASIAKNASEFSLKINEDEETMTSGNTGVVVCIKKRGYLDAGKHSKQPVRLSSDELIRKASQHDSRAVSWGSTWMPGVLNPHTKLVKVWNMIFCISSLVAIFVDPLFFFVVSVRQDYYCLAFDNTAAVAVTVVRTLTDAIHVCHIVLQFRLAYTIRDSKVRGAKELVDDPKRIALRYLKGWFILDVITALPLPQILILPLLKGVLWRPGRPIDTMGWLVLVLVQNIPRSIRIWTSLLGRTRSGFVFETARSSFVICLLDTLLVLAGTYLVYSVSMFVWIDIVTWRVVVLILQVPHIMKAPLEICSSAIEIFSIVAVERLVFALDLITIRIILWMKYTHVGNFCLDPQSRSFAYGIYLNGFPVITDNNAINKYFYSFAWGFVQISSLPGSQLPAVFIWEALFTMCISGLGDLGLLLAAVLIGNIQSSLQNVGQRRVTEARRFRSAVTMGVIEQELMDDLPEDLQEDIQRFLCLDLVKKVRLFELLEDYVLDAICERLLRKLYIEGSEIFRLKKPVRRMLFIVRGKLESRGEDGSTVQLQEGDFCGEELLSRYIDKNVVSST